MVNENQIDSVVHFLEEGQINIICSVLNTIMRNIKDEKIMRLQTIVISEKYTQNQNLKK
jgi:hypothetical protein